MDQANVVLLWIPFQCRFGLRFLNHTLYCLWFASQDGPLAPMLHHARHLVIYLSNIHTLFLQEVVHRWYQPSAQLGDRGDPIQDREKFRSLVLSTFLLPMYEGDTPIPFEPNSRNRSTPTWWEKDTMELDWSKWRERNPLNQLIFGAVPGEGTEGFEALRKSYKRVGIPFVPNSLVEIDADSWGMYHSELIKQWENLKQPEPT
ncbi:hypothetical protein L210DRAFT_3646223 [Boletus edulis BED1]|uniref:Uncharacterized protein n=1 Tax=Boletus edulis BED1 TaxID=1328754 RepID=A0AAD4BT32_BOLED|nr:hypothetical protein L210DRAFT_3646223 [Boletus edulis BED1]